MPRLASRAAHTEYDLQSLLDDGFFLFLSLSLSFVLGFLSSGSFHLEKVNSDSSFQLQTHALQHWDSVDMTLCINPCFCFLCRLSETHAGLPGRASRRHLDATFMSLVSFLATSVSWPMFWDPSLSLLSK